VKPAVAAAAGLVLLAACSRDAADDVPPDPVVVYAAEQDAADWPAFFRTYTKETGVVVIVRETSPESIVDDVIENAISPPADVLLSHTAAGAERAAGDGALRPLPPGFDAGAVPNGLKDPDGYWVGIAMRTTGIAVDTRAVTDMPADFVALAGPAWAGRLCLSSSGLPVNRGVVATLIGDRGVHEAELAVRGWVANLSRPVFADEAALLQAIADGECAAGIVSSQAHAGRLATDARARGVVRLDFAGPGLADVDAAGIGRHARNPEGAARLIQWLLRVDVQQRYGRSTRQFETVIGGGNPAGIDVASFALSPLRWEYEAVRLVERARYP
jgi:iron(III) transport system substrate-binding protein